MGLKRWKTSRLMMRVRLMKTPQLRQLMTSSWTVWIVELWQECEVTVSMRQIDNHEEERVRQFGCQGCSCKNGPNNSPCCLLFSVSYYQSLRDTLSEMTHDELDLLVMGQVMAHTVQTKHVQCHHGASPAERKLIHCQFFHLGHHVCQTTFLFLHTIGTKRFKNLKRSYLDNGPVVRVHGNSGRKPKFHLTLQQIKDIVQYILNYTGKKKKYMYI